MILLCLGGCNLPFAIPISIRYNDDDCFVIDCGRTEEVNRIRQIKIDPQIKFIWELSIEIHAYYTFKFQVPSNIILIELFLNIHNIICTIDIV